MGGRLTGRGLFGSEFTRPHTAGLEGGARVASVAAGTLLIASGVLHISAAGDHTNLPVMTAGFLVVAMLQGALGGLLLFRRPGRLVVAAGVAFTLGALGAWLLSRTVGLPFLPGGHMEPIGFKDGATVLFEAATVPALALLASAELDRLTLPSPRLGTRAVGVLGAGVFALFVPALVLGGGEHHSAAEMAAHGHGEDGHGGQELAQADTDHLHDGGSSSHHAGEDHAGKAGADHPHGRRATAAVFSDAHRDAGIHAHGGGAPVAGTDHPHGGGGQGPDRHEHTGGGGDGGGTQQGHGDDHGGEQGDRGHGHGGDSPGGGGHGGGGHAEDHAPDGHAAADPPHRSVALEQGHDGGDGTPPQGPALVFREPANEQVNGAGHAHEGACEPTAEQQAAADAIVAGVKAELKQYENNPAAALEDGFNYVFGPTDRMLHVVHTGRMADPDVVKPGEIESFIYYMTDTGFVPIAGMFIMPRDATSGPQPGGCLTQWHSHGGFVGRWATAGTSESTPQMMHVFTYPGLDPWGHYSGRDLAHLWTPGRYVPSVCRQADDANNGCLP